MKHVRETKPELSEGQKEFAQSMKRTLVDRMGMDKDSAGEMAAECVRTWPDKKVVKLAAAAAEEGVQLTDKSMQLFEDLLAAQKKYSGGNRSIEEAGVGGQAGSSSVVVGVKGSQKSDGGVDRNLESGTGAIRGKIEASGGT